MATLPICPHHITPTDAKINLAAAKKVFRQWMLLTGHLDEIELPDHVIYLVEAIKEEESFLKGEFERANEEIQEELSELRTQIGNLEKALLNEIDAARRSALQLDFEIATGERDELLEHVEERRAAYLSFKEDKRHFLIQYINQQTQRAA